MIMGHFKKFLFAAQAPPLFNIYITSSLWDFKRANPQKIMARETRHIQALVLD